MVLAAVLIHWLSVIAINEDDYEGDHVGVFMLMLHGDVDDDHDDEDGDAVDDDGNVIRGVGGYHTCVPRGASIRVAVWMLLVYGRDGMVLVNRHA